MPYQQLVDLPDSVKDNLPHHAQAIYKESYPRWQVKVLLP